MIRDMIEFFRQEKKYTLLLLLMALFYVLMWKMPPAGEVEAVRESPVLEEFRQAEKKVHQDIEKSGSLKTYLEDKPALSNLFQVLSFLAAGAFSAGLIINFFLLFNPNWRRSLANHAARSDQTPWKFSMLVKVILLWMAGSVGLNFVLLMVRQWLYPEGSLNFYLLMHTTISDILCVLFMIYIVKKSGGNWHDLGLRVPGGRWGHEILMGFGGYLAVLPIFFAVLIFLSYVAQFFSYDPPPHPLVTVFLEEDRRSQGIVFYSVFLASFLAPIFEEVFFRGFCYPIFKARWGSTLGVALSAGLFALIHHNTFAFWPIFILGVAMAYVYEKRRSLLSSIVLHVTHNTFFIGYFFLAKQVVIPGLALH